MSQAQISILDLTANEARQFFLKNENYCNLSLPPYFSFENLLSQLSNNLSGRPLFNVLGEPAVKNMADTQELNHIIYANKDGNLSWRPFQIIHPLAYLALVNCLTEEQNWKRIQRRFKRLQFHAKNILCCSIPVNSNNINTSNKAQQILQWWNAIEQKSIFLSLEYDYIFHTDVSDCYSSIYTHTIAWAIDGKKLAKTKNYRNNKNISGQDKCYLGNKIDKCIQQMQNRQTNGIPQGSVLMDFIAEILFGYLDILLTSEIKKENIINYQILRYRDDYRIFVKNKADGSKILRILSGLLKPFGLKLNSSKTQISSDVITHSIKEDKLASLELLFHEKMSLQKKLLLLRKHGENYPNSGSLIRLLSYLREIANLEEEHINYGVIISILIDIALHNPKAIPNICAFISDLLPKISSNDEIKEMIFNKLSNMSNSGLAQIWLQRILKNNLNKYPFHEKLCNQVERNKFASDFWDISWLPNNPKGNQIKQIMNTSQIIDWDIFDKLPEYIPKEEVNIFNPYY